jgi:Ca-activated chloride channel family protein
MGNYNDRLMERLADAGNGNHAYVDSLNEARKVLVEQMSGTLHTIAKDVKIQVEFNPAAVAEYRLIGYENRLLKREDFNNDRVDAGDIGAGHSVTALYEITLKGDQGSIDPLRYGKEAAHAPRADELAWLKLRYKAPEGDGSKLLEFPLQRSLIREIARTSDDFRFAASVAAFGQILRGGEHMGDYRLDEVLALARKARGQDESGYRGEFVQLVDLARALMPAKIARYGNGRD